MLFKIEVQEVTQNIKTKEEVEVMGLDLSHSAFILDKTPYLACRLCTYDDITFIISGEFVFECDELDAYIETYLKFNHNDLDFFVNIAKIRAIQNDPRVK